MRDVSRSVRNLTTLFAAPGVWRSSPLKSGVWPALTLKRATASCALRCRFAPHKGRNREEPLIAVRPLASRWPGLALWYDLTQLREAP